MIIIESTPGFVTPEMEKLLDEKYQQWVDLNMQQSAVYGLLLMLIEGMLEGPDPAHLDGMIKFMSEQHHRKINRNRSEVRSV